MGSSETHDQLIATANDFLTSLNSGNTNDISNSILCTLLYADDVLLYTTIFYR